MAQRAAWKLFADKYKLGFDKEKGVYGRAFVSGAIGGRRLNLFSVTDVRDVAYVRENFVHIEVFLNDVPQALMLFSAKALPDFAQEYSLPQELMFKAGIMPESLQIAQSDDAGAAKEWLGEGKRAQALGAFMREAANEDVEALFMAEGENAFLLWRTRHVMRDARELNAVVQRLFGYAKDMDSKDAKDSQDTQDIKAV